MLIQTCLLPHLQTSAFSVHRSKLTFLEGDVAGRAFLHLYNKYSIIHTFKQIPEESFSIISKLLFVVLATNGKTLALT